MTLTSVRFAAIQTGAFRLGESDTLIDSNFFPNTQTNSYWTSTVVKGSSKLAYEIPFFYGGSMARDKTIDTFIRLVRSAD